MKADSPFGPNLRAFVLYLRYTQAISFERLARLMSDLLGRRISEGALNNMLDASRNGVCLAGQPDPPAPAVRHRVAVR